MKVVVLGTGCKKCNDLAANVKQAAADQGVEVSIEKVTDLNQIMTYGCMTTPGLVMDGTLVSQGKLLKVEQIAKFFHAK
ncbi:MAG: thioredoxin family protein [Desulfobacteraceae bacterium 4572_35.2]|nr:MAG: thioredoxin family protein [Desulfobacteraceae bacterium 4572_35.2]